MRSISLSPQGTVLAEVSDRGGRPQPWVRPLDGSRPPRLLPVEGTVVRAVWRPDGRRVLVQVDPDGGETYALSEVDPETGEVFPVAIAPGVRRELTIPYGSIGCPYSPDSRLLAYATDERDRSCFDVVVRELATGAERTVLRSGEHAPADRYLPTFFSPDGRRLLVLRLHQNTEQDLFVCDLATGAVEHVTPHDGAAKYLPAGWTDDGIVVCTTAGQDLLHVATLRPDGAVAPLVTAEAEIPLAVLTPDGRWLFYAVNADGFTTLRRRETATGNDIALAGLPAGVAGAEWGGDGQNLVPTPDGAALAVLLDTPSAPGEPWLVDVEGGTAGPLDDPDRPRPSGIVPAVVRFPSDGVTVPGLFYRPAGPEGPVPAVLLIHGGPEAQTMAIHDDLIDMLLADGIAVLAPNVRGSSGYGQAYQRLVYRDWGGGDLRDWAAAAAWLRGQDGIDGDRIGVFGESYGGFAAMSCLSRLPELWRVGVAGCGMSDLVSDAREFPPTWARRIRDWVGDPDDPADRAMLTERSPLTHADAIRAPLLLIHGENDSRVHISQSELMHDKLVARGHPVRFDRFAGEGHNVSDAATRQHQLRTAADWLRDHLTH